MANIKFPGVVGGEYNKLTIQQDENEMSYRLNGILIPNVLDVKLIALDTVPRIEITVAINEVDGDFSQIVAE